MRYTPFESMDRMVEQMRRDMAEWREDVGDFGYFGDFDARGLNMDLSEHDGEFVFTADLPGFEKDEIDLRIEEGALLLSARHEGGAEGSMRSRSVTERVALSREVVEDEVTATYRNGVLEVHLPIVEGAEDHGRRIDVE